MADLSDFLPLFDADEDAIYAEMAARANEGVRPDDPAYVDTRVGSFFYLSQRPCAVGLAAAYGRMNEAVAAGIVATSWEGYLDLHAESYGAERKAATYATGKVQFVGLPGSLVPSGTRALPAQTDPDIDPPIFETTESGMLPAGIGDPTPGPGLFVNAGGTLATSTAYYYHVVAVDAEGSETGPSPRSTASTSPIDRTINMTWIAVAGAVGYRVYRALAPSGPYSVFNATTVDGPNGPIAVSSVLPGYADTGTLAPVAATLPTTNGTGGKLTLAVRALAPGEASNIAAGKIVQLDSGVPGIASLTNPKPMSGGTEVESDSALKTRLKQRFQGGQGANKAWYAARALEQPGVGRVTVVANWSGGGTVLLIVMDEAGRAVPASVVDALQRRLDPTAGQGDGEASIDHEVTVMTPVEVPIDANVPVTLAPGYTLDGDEGTIASRESIDRAVRDFINSHGATQDGHYNALRAAPFDVEGVIDVGTIQWRRDAVAFGTSNITIQDDPPEVMVADVITITAV